MRGRWGRLKGQITTHEAIRDVILSLENSASVSQVADATVLKRHLVQRYMKELHDRGWTTRCSGVRDKKGGRLHSVRDHARNLN